MKSESPKSTYTTFLRAQKSLQNPAGKNQPLRTIWQWVSPNCFSEYDLIRKQRRTQKLVGTTKCKNYSLRSQAHYNNYSRNILKPRIGVVTSFCNFYGYNTVPQLFWSLNTFEPRTQNFFFETTT